MEDDIDDNPDLGDSDDDLDDEDEATPTEHLPERLGRGHRTKIPNTQIWDGDHDIDRCQQSNVPPRVH